MDADITYGSPESREDDLGRAKQLNIAVSVVAVAAAATNFFGVAALRFPADVALGLLPVVLMYLVQDEPQVYAIGKPKGDQKHTDLCFAFMVCGIGLMAGLGDVHFVQWATVLECGGLVGLLCCCVTFAPARASSGFWGAMLSAALMGLIYGCGLVGTLDSLWDKSAPANYTTSVTNKYESHGKSTTYDLALAPWGPMGEQESLTVSKQTYDSTGIGSQVCLELHSGVIHVQWYRMVACDRKTLE